MLNWFSSPIIQIIISFILGIIISYYFYMLSSRKRANPKWAITSSIPILYPNQNITESLQVKYNQKLYNKLTATTICFWNDGKKGITQADLSCPISFQLEKGIKIVSLVGINPSNKVIGITVKKEENFNDTDQENKNIQSSVILDFRILNPFEGIVFTILHTGETDQKITTNVSILDTLLVETPAFPAQEKLFREKIFWTAYFPIGLSIGLFFILALEIISIYYFPKEQLLVIGFILGASFSLLSDRLAKKFKYRSYLPIWAKRFITKGL